MSLLKFTKMHGLGNDFMVIDAINQSVNLSEESVRALADRHRGVGFDQLLLVEHPVNPVADFGYRIFNADGGEVAQCGNGARCFAQFVHEKQLTDKNPIMVETKAGLMTLSLEQDGQVTVNMGIPKSIKDEVVEGQEGVSLALGNPHFVISVTEVGSAPVNTLGADLTGHSHFPEGANIGFMEVKDFHSVLLRVHERGAGETEACGSGACAAVVAGITQGVLESPVRVHLTGGDLNIVWEGPDKPVKMTGPTAKVFEGVIEV